MLVILKKHLKILYEVAELLEEKIQTKSKDLEKIWEKSTEELLSDVKNHYEAIDNIDKQTVINQKSLNAHIRFLSLKMEELIQRGELPYDKQDVCAVMTKKLAHCHKSIRVTIAQQLDSRFKRKYNLGEAFRKSNVGEPTFENSQSEVIFENIKASIQFAKQHLSNMTPSAVQDLKDITSSLDNAVEKYCEENDIETVDTTGFESGLDRLRKKAKGKPTACPTPDEWEQREIKTDNKSDNEILESLRTLKAKAIFRYAMAWRDVAFHSDNHPAQLEGDDEMIALTFDRHRELIQCYNDIKVKRDNAQWCEIVNQFLNVSKHNASAADKLDVFGTSCSNCGSTMYPMEKKRDLYRLYWRCPNYYKTEDQFVGCKADKPVSRACSKERITELQKKINQWAADIWSTIPVYFAFLYDFRNYKQPYHTEHTKLLEPKFENRGN
jgi:hypothetical protein